MRTPQVGDGGIVQIIPLVRVHHLGDRRFVYLVPKELVDLVHLGSVVGVQFGSRHVRGVVVGIAGPVPDQGVQLRPIDSVEESHVTPELLRLAEKLAHGCLASLESCLRLVVPPAPGRQGAKRDPFSKSWAYPLSAGAEGLTESLTPKQKSLLSAIPEEGVAVAAACASAGVGKTVLDALVHKGLIRLGGPSGEVACGPTTAVVPELLSGQRAAVQTLIADFKSPGLARRQLWGVTGSGKTEVYLRLMTQALEDGAGVILLVPEIALTPLMIERVRLRLGDAIGVLHSGLTPVQRKKEYARIASGEVRVVVGARSAVFAPVSDLRLVIIDESHDTSYKQEESPGYHVRTVAELRMQERGGLLLEGSASPALESMVHIDACVRLSERARGALPQCEVVDMRQQSGSGVLAAATREALAQTLRRGEQAIVLLNRRGYSGYVHCDACGHVMMCEDCELTLTYHSQTRRLLCHHCGRSYVQPPVCPNCEEAPLARGGPGTERLADELSRLVSGKQIFRLDSDVLTSGARVRSILEKFSESHPAVLVGTQMVAKGHDFPDVTLVVVADADTGLYSPDFRASERTFQLLTQVSGRAGRAERPGRVLVQTWNPEVPCIKMALERNEKAFYLRELGIRERLGYPPFSQLIRLVTVGEQAERVQLAARHLADSLSPHFGAGEVRGPARLPGLRGKNRWHIVVSSGDGERARTIVAQAITQLSEPYRRRGVGLSVDVDPFSFI